ncbi:hypothetical protein [Pseudomonas extremaustralis]|uniref:hypothetical protein n=1 Tax=Pseudomonas extremaustralis TaxID=359110 RepID=UPI0023DFB1B0|nr:hypothetical protein [Pseudomonas extremaustralis]MDF3136941.1 hypothetical protein [Pseudomonas extremaustralis]
MSTPSAGTTQKRLFSRNDYLAPLPIPTGEEPSDVLTIIWRKNEVFVDIGNYSIGAAVMTIWPMMVLFALMSYITPEPLIWGGGLIIVGIPILFVIQGLFRAVPLPVRFNRQRREVCVPRGEDEYWIVPWESVTAAATQHSSVSQVGRTTMGLLIIGFENPDPQAKDDNKHFSFGFNCGGGTTAMALWECIRSYMEIGPQAVPKAAALNAGENLRFYLDYMRDKAKTRGWILTLLWDGILGVFVFNAPLAQYLQRKKLYPPPDLTYPAIIEWSKPLPPEQWAKRSAELETAIAKREAELAVQTAQASEDRP